MPVGAIRYALARGSDGAVETDSTLWRLGTEAFPAH